MVKKYLNSVFIFIIIFLSSAIYAAYETLATDKDQPLKAGQSITFSLPAHQPIEVDWTVGTKTSKTIPTGSVSLHLSNTCVARTHSSPPNWKKSYDGYTLRDVVGINTGPNCKVSLINNTNANLNVNFRVWK